MHLTLPLYNLSNLLILIYAYEAFLIYKLPIISNDSCIMKQMRWWTVIHHLIIILVTTFLGTLSLSNIRPGVSLLPSHLQSWCCSNEKSRFNSNKFHWVISQVIAICKRILNWNYSQVSHTAKLTGPRILADKRWVGPVKLLCITMFDISKIRPKSLLGPVKTKKFSRCLRSNRVNHTIYWHQWVNHITLYSDPTGARKCNGSCLKTWSGLWRFQNWSYSTNNSEIIW